MSERDDRNNGSLVPAGPRDLAAVGATNPLISRGFADLAQDRFFRLTDAISLARHSALFFLNRGMDWLDKCDDENAIKDFDEAIRLFDEVIRLDHNNPFAYRHRGKSWLAKNRAGSDDEHSGNEDYDKAIKDFDEAIRLDSKSALAYVERAEAWLAGFSEAFGDAIKDLDQAVRLDPKFARELLKDWLRQGRTGCTTLTHQEREFIKLRYVLSNE